MPELVKLIGLDFGTTTSSAVISSARLQRTATGRMVLDWHQELLHSELVFTPFRADQQLDLDLAAHLLDGWLAAGQVQPAEIFGGGALLTGLAAKAPNATSLVALIRRRLGDALIATADDPCLESWLAYLGNCAILAQMQPERFILNLDIGGGTTNIALGRHSDVLRTGCLFLGARHVQVVPGTYRIVQLSPYATDLLVHLRIARRPGDELDPSDVEAIVKFHVTTLEAICAGKPVIDPIVKRLQQVPFQMPEDVCDVTVTFSGGVGELIYRHLQGEPWPPTTHYGDLGIDLARGIVAAPTWAESLEAHRPPSGGRATVYGLLRHATEVSGSTWFVGASDILPLTDFPILGSVHVDWADARIRAVMTLVRQSSRGGAVWVRIGSHEADAVRTLGRRLASILERDAFPPDHPLVLLVEENVGKVLGHYITGWGALPVRLLVIDQVRFRDAQYVQIGLPRGPVVPVSFFGIIPHGDLT